SCDPSATLVPTILRTAVLTLLDHEIPRGLSAAPPPRRGRRRSACGRRECKRIELVDQRAAPHGRARPWTPRKITSSVAESRSKLLHAEPDDRAPHTS